MIDRTKANLYTWAIGQLIYSMPSDIDALRRDVLMATRSPSVFRGSPYSDQCKTLNYVHPTERSYQTTVSIGLCGWVGEHRLYSHDCNSNAGCLYIVSPLCLYVLQEFLSIPMHYMHTHADTCLDWHACGGVALAWECVCVDIIWKYSTCLNINIILSLVVW